MIGEALIGAGIVKLRLGEHDASIKRAIAMGVHLTNTFFLLAALALTAWWASGGAPMRVRRQGAAPWVLAPAFLGMLLLGTSGAMAALGDTLFPAHSLAEGMAQDLSPGAHVFLRLRMLHPFIAIITGVCVFAAATVLRHVRPTAQVVRASRFVTVAFLAQLGAGLVNLMLLAPVGMQLVHLVLADAVWISLVILAAAALAEEGAREAARGSEARSLAS